MQARSWTVLVALPGRAVLGPQLGTQLLLMAQMGKEAQRLTLAFPVLRQHAPPGEADSTQSRGSHPWALQPLSTDAGQGQGTLEKGPLPSVLRGRATSPGSEGTPAGSNLRGSRRSWRGQRTWGVQGCGPEPAQKPRPDRDWDSSPIATP